jgi:hypothetical protein
MMVQAPNRTLRQILLDSPGEAMMRRAGRRLKVEVADAYTARPVVALPRGKRLMRTPAHQNSGPVAHGVDIFADSLSALAGVDNREYDQSEFTYPVRMSDLLARSECPTSLSRHALIVAGLPRGGYAQPCDTGSHEDFRRVE